MSSRAAKKRKQRMENAGPMTLEEVLRMTWVGREEEWVNPPIPRGRAAEILAACDNENRKP